jgi:signal transduction histidine kinase
MTDEVDDDLDYRLLFESLPNLYLILSPDFRIVEASDAYLRATMTARDDIIGQQLFDVFPDNPADTSADGTRNLRASLELVLRDRTSDTMAVQKYDIKKPATEGGGYEVRYWSPVNSPAIDERGRLRYLIHRVEDVTEYIRREEPRGALAAEAATEWIDLEIFERARELQQANQRLVEVDRAKSEFLSRMSHELRTPLNSILGFSQLLQREELTEDQHDSVEHIAKAGKHLLELINEVLDLARIEARRVDLSPEAVAIDEVVQEVMELMRPVASQRAIDMRATAPSQFVIRVDRQRLRQILLNLLSNAVKYNRLNGSIALSCSQPNAGRVRISVNDSGFGIRPEHFGEVFQPFARFSSDDVTIEGTGIGLVLVKNLAEIMGGSVGFESEYGQGSTFWVEFPLIEPAQAQAFMEAPVPGVRNNFGWRGRILYIEDNLANLTLIERILRNEPGVELLSAMQGRLGLELAAEHLPDLVLLDVHLPDMQGDEVLRDLRANERTADIPVVVLSADATDRQMRRMLDAHAVAYLTKPIDLDAFEETVGSVLQRGVT